MNSQLSGYLEANQLLDERQSGFRPAHGTESALVTVLDDLRMTADQGQFVALVLLDLSAAFDMVDHSILLSRLADCGDQGPALGWCKSYLDNRVKLCGCHHFTPTLDYSSRGSRRVPPSAPRCLAFIVPL